MKDEIQNKDDNANKIEFNPIPKIDNKDISIDSLNFEIDEKEILKVYDISDEWNKFFSEKEYQSLFEEYLDIKKANINAVYSNPLYFIKKIIYFYNKETFIDSFLFKLKTPPNEKQKQYNANKKSISFKVDFDNENKKALLSFDLEKKLFNGKIKPDNKNISIPFSIDSNNDILIPINNYDEKKNELKLIPKLIKNKSEKINVESNCDEIKIEKIQNEYLEENKGEITINKNSNDSKEHNKENNSHTKGSSTISKILNSSFELSKNETLLSYDEKENENFKILVRENNDNLLNVFQREKLEGETYESIANKTLELMCNISLNRNIEVKNYMAKNAKKINIFFNLKGENKIKDFQIDSYISKITGKELKKIKEKFPNHFFFFENLNLKDSEIYEVIGEISQNIVNNSRQKISQEFNYIHLIKYFNNYHEKEKSDFISLCNDYGLNNDEKIFILITDGSYIKTKYLINILNNNINEIENLINEKKGKNEIINVLSGYFNDKTAFNLLEINIERFYNFCMFYNNLKMSGIKFCFCFISDIIEDKLENILEEKIKLYKDYDKDIEQNIGLVDDFECKQQKNEFIERISEILEKNNKLKSNLMIISNKINRKIKDFVANKNDILKKLDEFFVKFDKKNNDNFYEISKKLIQDISGQDLFFKNIYLNKMFFFFILLLPKENIIDIKKIKNSIKIIDKGLSFEIIHKDDINEIDNYIKSQNMDKLKINIFISNNDNQLMKAEFKHMFQKNYTYFFYLLKEQKVDICIEDIIKRNITNSVQLFIDDFYHNKKCYLPNVKESKEILSKDNILDKIKYDLKLLKMKKEKVKDIPNEFNYAFVIDKEDDNELKKIVNDYHDSIIFMIEELLNISKIKNDKNVVNIFINKDKFFNVFNNLFENMKFKCFYRYFLLDYLKKIALYYMKIDLERIKIEI